MTKRRKARELSRRAALGAAVGGVGELFGCARTGLELDGGSGATSGAPPDGSVGGTGNTGGKPVAPIFEPERVPEDGGTFDLGVQAGEMTADSVLFWTHVASGEGVELCVWPESSGARPERLHVFAVEPSPGGFAHERATGLSPGTRYRYAFFDRRRTRRSRIGRVRTAPSGERGEPLRIGSLACTNFAYLPYRTAELLALEPLDVFIHAGDMSYNDGAQTLEEYREKWRSTLGSAGYRALLASTGAYFTWDDHEVTNDFDAEDLALSSPEYFAVARAAFFESLPKRPNESGGLWQSFRWGSTAELFVLDCRGERRPSTLNGERPIFVSDAQLDWLREGLAASRSHFKIIVTSVPIGRLSEELWASPFERWEGYAAQREELLAFIDAMGIENVWFLSGDLHMGLVHRVDRSGRDARHWEICSGPGGQSSHDLPLFQPGAEERHARAFPPEQVAYASHELAYTTFEFDPAADSVRVRFVNVEGQTAFDRVLSHQA
ncbi:MAG TPA: alkaline phosphatase D family protein [Polyangiaceae bacterium]